MTLFAPLVLALALHAQSAAPREVALDKPERVLAVEFTQIRGVRELRDGRVIVVDRLEKGVVVADFATGAIQKIGATGRGPQEYRIPTGLIAIPGDSTLLIDEGNSRVAIIGPDLRIHRSFTVMIPGVAAPMGARGIDARGRYILQIPGWANPGAARNDSLVAVRFDERAKVLDTLFRVRGMTLPPPGPVLHARIPYVIFAPQDIWSVAADGRIAIVRSGDYHVEWREVDGRTVRGPAIPHERAPVTTADRIAYTRRFLENSATSGRDLDGGLSAIPAAERSDSAVRSMAARNLFAETRPPFSDAAPLISPEGGLWVERSTPLGAPSAWDVFNRSGQRTERVRLPPNRRLVALGATSLYAVVADDDGIERLERYRR